jgi:prolyl oligopeptidase
MGYPKTKKIEQVDDYFGTKVSDPYRWLENDESVEVKEWVEVQNEKTFDYLSSIPFREKIKSRLTDIFDYPRFSLPFRAGEYYFFYKNNGLQNQYVIYLQKGIDGKPEVFIDPNTLSPDGSIIVNIAGFSADKKLMALTRKEAGSDWSEIRIMEIASRRELPDRIQWVKFSEASFRGNGFYYSTFDKPAPGTELSAKNEYNKVYFHTLGEPQEADRLVYQDKENPEHYFSFSVTEDETRAFLEVIPGTYGTELYSIDFHGDVETFHCIVKGFDNEARGLANIRDSFLVHTNTDAPNYKVVLINPENPAPENWKTIVPERTDVLQNVNTCGGYLFCTYLSDAHSKVFQYSLDGRLIREVQLPTLGSVYGFKGWKDDKTLFYLFTSFTFPGTAYKYDIESGASGIFRKSEVKFNPDDYEVKQVFFESRDKTKVPMFIVNKKGISKNRKNPCLLTGYGGFNAIVQPQFNSANILLLENNGIFAIACLRGGGEYGETWHKAGMLLDKQNVFDDFIAAAEYLVREKYTSRDFLAITGESNGGLIVGAVMTQRPDLCKVAIPVVGVMDMLRYHKFTIGAAWAVEYGNIDDEVHFRNLYSYSPLHNIRDGVSYPATLAMTADHDDRVVPAHSFKFIATLQEKNTGELPVLIRIETRSGHGSVNMTKMIDGITDKFSFMFAVIGITPVSE